MKKLILILVVAAALITGCNKPDTMKEKLMDDVWMLQSSQMFISGYQPVTSNFVQYKITWEFNDGDVSVYYNGVLKDRTLIKYQEPNTILRSSNGKVMYVVDGEIGKELVLKDESVDKVIKYYLKKK